MTALELIENVEILTQEQYEIVAAYDKENSTNLVWTYLNNIGPDFHTGITRWLNSNVYSEIDKEEYDLQREMGY
jgi:hypothetical protein